MQNYRANDKFHAQASAEAIHRHGFSATIHSATTANGYRTRTWIRTEAPFSVVVQAMHEARSTVEA